MKLRIVFAALLIFFGVALALFIGMSFLSSWSVGAAKIAQEPTLALGAELSSTTTPSATLTFFPPTVSPTKTDLRQMHPSSTAATTRAITAAPTPSPLRTASPTLVVATPTITPAPVGKLPAPQRIVIEKINVNAKVVPMRWSAYVADGRWQSQWDVPQNDAGHIYDTPNPGELGNVVMAGHNNLYAAIFKKLYTLNPGDKVEIYNSAGQGYLYRVVESYLLAEEGQPPAKRVENAKVMNPTNDARLTLISCWPEWSNEYRAIVIAKLVGRVN